MAEDNNNLLAAHDAVQDVMAAFLMAAANENGGGGGGGAAGAGAGGAAGAGGGGEGLLGGGDGTGKGTGARKAYKKGGGDRPTVKIGYKGSETYLAIQRKNASAEEESSEMGRVYMAGVVGEDGNPVADSRLGMLKVEGTNSLLRKDIREGKQQRLVFERAVKRVDGAWCWAKPSVGNLAEFVLTTVSKDEYEAYEGSLLGARAGKAGKKRARVEGGGLH